MVHITLFECSFADSFVYSRFIISVDADIMTTNINQKQSTMILQEEVKVQAGYLKRGNGTVAAVREGINHKNCKTGNYKLDDSN